MSYLSDKFVFFCSCSSPRVLMSFSNVFPWSCRCTQVNLVNLILILVPVINGLFAFPQYLSSWLILVSVDFSHHPCPISQTKSSLVDDIGGKLILVARPQLLNLLLDKFISSVLLSLFNSHHFS